MTTDKIQINKATAEYINKILGVDIFDQGQRISLAQSSLTMFCLIYLGHYFNLAPAKFHRKLVRILEDDTAEAIGVIGFRGSAKSTFCSLAYPIWCAVTKKFNFMILINDTTPQVKLNIANIKAELEENQLISLDFPGSYVANEKKWTETELLIGQDVFLIGKSRGQKVRGLRFRQYRPELIIIDDPEDLEWTRKKENRNKTERWLNTEVVPAQEESKCKLIIIGNLLHKDALMGRIKKRGTFKVFEFSLIDKKGKCTWKGKYPTKEAIAKQKARIGSNIIWQREYLLKILAEEEQVITEQDVVFYDPERLQLKGELGISPIDAGVGIDLAISEKQTADFTTMVAGIVAREYSNVGIDGTRGNGVRVVYIKPNPVNKRLDLEQTINHAQTVYKALPYGSKLFVEAVAYQLACIKEMRKKGLPVREMRAITDKRARLETVAMYIKQGLVRFPKTGCEDLIEQLVGFGIEEHDDLCLVGDTIIATSKGNKKIKNIKKGDKVITPFGFRKVLASRNTGYKETISKFGITGTKGHKVFSHLNGFARLDILRYNEGISKLNIKSQITWRYKKLLYLMEQNTKSWEGRKSITLVNQIQIKGGNILKDFMLRSGSLITKKKYLKVLKYTIKTITVLIMILKIWSVYQFHNIVNYIVKNILKSKYRKKMIILKEYARLLLSGINQKMAGSGMRKKQKNNGKIQKNIKGFAKYVKQSLTDCTVIQHVVAQNVDIKTMQKETQTELGRQIKDMQIKKEEVYNITVEEDGCYYANGILVGNCDALVYLLLGLFNTKKTSVGFEKAGAI